jgi:hypothetical protein
MRNAECTDHPSNTANPSSIAETPDNAAVRLGQDNRRQDRVGACTLYYRPLQYSALALAARLGTGFRGAAYNEAMESTSERTVLKLLRSVLGILLMLCSGAVLVDGGFSRYAKYGIPPHTNWSIIAFGLILLSSGAFLLRPTWFLRARSK